MKLIRVLLADSHQLFRAGVRAILAQYADLEVVGEAGTGRDALREVRACRPDVVLMDTLLPELNGIDVTARLVTEFPNVRVIILASGAAEQHILHALEAGAGGYLLKSSSPVELEMAIRSVVRGEVFLSPAVSKSVIEEYRKHPNSKHLTAGLTLRQREVLQLVTEGYTSKEIAKKLDLSVKSVEAHRAQVMAALNIHNVPGLVRYAIRTGLIRPD